MNTTINLNTLLIVIICFFIIYYFYNIITKKPVYAIAVFNDTIKGYVKFSEDLTNNRVQIDLNIVGLKPNSLHGFHVHQAGDLTDGCTSMCSHFNPYGNTHGSPGHSSLEEGTINPPKEVKGCPSIPVPFREMKNRHAGDLGNIKTNDKGEAIYTFYDDMIKLRGTECNIIGRGLIIHADEDDCGKGGNAESLKTGNAGKRIACAVIGFSKENCI